ncbi:hypothetical protein CPB84DRAFT_1903936 [Gymnopilus junonius]|uniref:Uncharacterized protein n=1 Tax=Gymnopilus junonius TaxID=109634 RepID=A0A9P5N7E1_GYMJU|nr:hypothetical protein CPB84DRAFT_1903936 [Gymnopilus junonius]
MLGRRKAARLVDEEASYTSSQLPLSFPTQGRMLILSLNSWDSVTLWLSLDDPAKRFIIFEFDSLCMESRVKSYSLLTCLPHVTSFDIARNVNKVGGPRYGKEQGAMTLLSRPIFVISRGPSPLRRSSSPQMGCETCGEGEVGRGEVTGNSTRGTEKEEGRIEALRLVLGPTLTVEGSEALKEGAGRRTPVEVDYRRALGQSFLC